MNRTVKYLAVLALFFVLNAGVANAAQTFWDKEPVRAMHIYPNPAVDLINIEYKASADYRIVISNILGTVVYKSPNIDRFTENNVYHLSHLQVQSGIYLVKIYEGTELKATKKLIVRST